MAPNNFENSIKKMQLRKIEPSAQAWDRLDAMLTVAEKKQKPNPYFWLKIAASILVFTGVGYVFFQQNKENELNLNTNPALVKSTSKNINSENENSIKNDVKTNTELNNNQIALTIKPSLVKTTRLNSVDQLKKTVSKNTEALKYSPEVFVKENNQIVEIENKVEPKFSYKYVTPESLLAEIEGDKKVPNTIRNYPITIKVNPNELLTKVETELNQTFKEKAISRLNQAKNLLVNRNYK